jgi:histidinol-phosphate aminotransferase
MNENPEGLPKSFVDSVLKEITPEFLATYPEPDNFVAKYATYMHISENNVLTTNGSDMAIRYVFETFAKESSEVVTVSPTFGMYDVNCNILGLKHIPVEYEKDLTINVEKILNSINKGVRIVVLVNPNNPVGNVYSRENVERIIKRAKEVGAIVLIDEAYHYFYPNSLIDVALKYQNVIVLRTFSKLFSLAACRMGIVISNPTIIHYLRNARLTFETNSIALLFGERILENQGLINNLIESEITGKKYLVSELKKENYVYLECEGNFVLIKPKYFSPLEIEKVFVLKKENIDSFL